MKNNKHTAALSIDMDNKWSYMKTHGDHGWESLPSYYNVLVPYLLDLLDELGLSITFFIVGLDAKQECNEPYLRMIGERGHEPGNHSLSHEPWLHLYKKERIYEELSSTHKLIRDSFGTPPLGFRGPGFSWSVDLLEVILELGYKYDASTLPTFIGPLARLYYFWTAKLSKEEKNQRNKLFGTVTDGLRPVKPYLWKLPDERGLFEAPVTTIPLFRTPFHLSYLMYLSRYSETLMERYLQVAVMMCKLTKTPISFLLHPLDVLGGDQVPELKFFPGMDIDAKTKRERFIHVIKLLKRHFTIVNMSKYTEEISTGVESKQILASKK